MNLTYVREKAKGKMKQKSGRKRPQSGNQVYTDSQTVYITHSLRKNAGSDDLRREEKTKTGSLVKKIMAGLMTLALMLVCNSYTSSFQK